MSTIALRRRPLLIAFACLLAAQVIVGLPARPAAAAGPSAEAVLVQEFVEQLNAERGARDLTPLLVDQNITSDADAWADRMAATRTLDHSNDGRAEIIAYGHRTGQITDAWMRSPSHRHLIVDPNLAFAGFGVECDANGRLWAVVQFRRLDTRLGTLTSSTPGVTTPPSEGTTCQGAKFAGAIRRLYLAYFQRESDPSGLVYWVQARVDGRPLASVSDAFAASPEFRSTYGRLDNRAFVELVYRNVLGRAPDRAGRTYWVGQLNAGMSRGALMIGFSDSPEFIARTGIR